MGDREEFSREGEHWDVAPRLSWASSCVSLIGKIKVSWCWGHCHHSLNLLVAFAPGLSASILPLGLVMETSSCLCFWVWLNSPGIKGGGGVSPEEVLTVLVLASFSGLMSYGIFLTNVWSDCHGLGLIRNVEPWSHHIPVNQNLRFNKMPMRCVRTFKFDC